MDRPRKSDPRDQQLNISLTVSEFEALKHRAEACGMRPVHYGRSLVVGAQAQRASQPENLHARLLHTQLVRLGNNLNQLVRQLHSRGEALPCDVSALLTDIRRLIAQVPG